MFLRQFLGLNFCYTTLEAFIKILISLAYMQIVICIGLCVIDAIKHFYFGPIHKNLLKHDL